MLLALTIIEMRATFSTVAPLYLEGNRHDEDDRCASGRNRCSSPAQQARAHRSDVSGAEQRDRCSLPTHQARARRSDASRAGQL